MAGHEAAEADEDGPDDVAAHFALVVEGFPP